MNFTFQTLGYRHSKLKKKTVDRRNSQHFVQTFSLPNIKHISLKIGLSLKKFKKKSALILDIKSENTKYSITFLFIITLADPSQLNPWLFVYCASER